MAWVLFDLNGTLLDPRAIGLPLGVDGGEDLALAALDDAVGQAMTDTLAGDFRGFPEYLEAGLRWRLERGGHGDGGVTEAMEIAQQMPAFDGAATAIQTLREAGLRVGVLTNSARDSARQALEAAGLADGLEAVIGADAVEAYKPDRRVYAHALEEIGVAAADAWLVAAHWWDIVGAKQAGMRTAWVAHKEEVLLGTVPAPDVRGQTLHEVAAAIAENAA